MLGGKERDLLRILSEVKDICIAKRPGQPPSLIANGEVVLAINDDHTAHSYHRSREDLFDSSDLFGSMTYSA